VQRDEQAADVLREERKEAAQSEYLKWAEQRVRQVQLSRLCCATLMWYNRQLSDADVVVAAGWIC
jgi:hypothetical protein